MRYVISKGGELSPLCVRPSRLNETLATAAEMLALRGA